MILTPCPVCGHILDPKMDCRETGGEGTDRDLAWGVTCPICGREGPKISPYLHGDPEEICWALWDASCVTPDRSDWSDFIHNFYV